MSRRIGLSSPRGSGTRFDIRAAAERAVNFMQASVQMLEVDTAKKTLESLGDVELPDQVAPGKEYYARRITELASVFMALSLTSVTILAQGERAQLGQSVGPSQRWHS